MLGVQSGYRCRQSIQNFRIRLDPVILNPVDTVGSGTKLDLPIFRRIRIWIRCTPTGLFPDPTGSTDSKLLDTAGSENSGCGASAVNAKPSAHVSYAYNS